MTLFQNDNEKHDAWVTRIAESQRAILPRNRQKSNGYCSLNGQRPGMEANI